MEREEEENGRVDVTVASLLLSRGDCFRALVEMMGLDVGGVVNFSWKTLGTGWQIIAHMPICNK